MTTSAYQTGEPVPYDTAQATAVLPTQGAEGRLSGNVPKGNGGPGWTLAFCEMHQPTGARQAFAWPAPSRRPTGSAPEARSLDAKTLLRARAIVEDLDQADPAQATLALGSLAVLLRDLWAQAEQASANHQAILAMAESAVLSWDDLSGQRQAALRGALDDLSLALLTDSHVDVIRSRLIDAGWNPMAIVRDLDEAASD